MNESTLDLTTDEILKLILERLARLEAQSEERSNTTRPLLDRAIQEMIQTREILVERLSHIETKLDLMAADVMAADVMDVRTAQRRLGDRVSTLEQRSN